MKKLIGSVILFAIALSLIALPGSTTQGQGTIDWWNASWGHRIPVTMTTGNYGSEDNPVEWRVDLAGKLAGLGDSNPFDPNSVRVVEYNPDGTVKGEVPSQYEVPAPDYYGVAVVQYSDAYTTTIIGPTLTSLGIPFVDVTSAVTVDAIDYSKYSILIIDSFATQNSNIRTGLNGDAAQIEAFVNNGGVVLTFTQANQDLNGNDPLNTPGAIAWAPKVIKYSDPDGIVYFYDSSFQVWKNPNEITGPITTLGSYAACWECLTQLDPAYIKYAYSNAAPDTYALADLSWGRGKYIFTAMPADVAAAKGNLLGKNIVQNLYTYARSLVNHPLRSPELVWMMDGTTPPNSQRYYYVYFDSWDGADPATKKAAPAYVTDLSLAGTVIQNEHFNLDIGGFNTWIVKNFGTNAPIAWGTPTGIYTVTDYNAWGVPSKPVPAVVISTGPVRSIIRLSTSQGSSVDLSFYTKAAFYKRTVLKVPGIAASISIDTESPAGNAYPTVVASGTAPDSTSDIGGITDVQLTPAAVSGTSHAWLAVYSPTHKAGYAEIAAMDDIYRWGAERTGNPFTAEEYLTSRLPVVAWSYYFDYHTPSFDTSQLDTSTQRFANPPVLSEVELSPTYVNAGGDLTVYEGQSINFSGWVSTLLENPAYTWDFDDGTPTNSGTLLPTHSYPDEGIFTVTLTVTSSNFSPFEEQLTVTVLNAPPVVSAGPDQSVLVGQEVKLVGSFSDPGTSDTQTFEWQFGDDSEANTEKISPFHTYGSPGTYTATLTVTDNDGGVGVDSAVITVRLPAATAKINDPLVGAGSFVEAKGTDITIRNENLFLTVAKVTLDAQLKDLSSPVVYPTLGLGNVLDAGPNGLLDKLDWIKVGYFEPTRTEGANFWDIKTLDYPSVSITDPGIAHAEVTAAGEWINNTGVDVVTTYELEPFDHYVTITSTITNTTLLPVNFFFGDVLDYDFTDQQSYVPGVGYVTGSSTSTSIPYERWMGMWGIGPEVYAILYEDPVIVYATNYAQKSSREFNIAAGESVTFVRYLIIQDSSGYATPLEGMLDIINDFPPPAGAALPTVCVTEKDTDLPLIGAAVSFTDAVGGVSIRITGEDGCATFTLNPGTYRLNARLTGYFAAATQVVDLSEGASTWPIALEPRPSQGIDHVILVISDGLSLERMLAVDPAYTDHIRAMMAGGASASPGISEVPSVTATNTSTVHTGTYASTNGTVGNTYLSRAGAIVPIETMIHAATRQGLSAQSAGSASEIVTMINAGTLPSYTVWWWGGTDGAGHHDGPFSANYTAQISAMNGYIGQIMAALEASGMADSTVLGFGSDHGMQRLLPDGVTSPMESHVLDIRAILQAAGYPIYAWRGSGPRMAHIYLQTPVDPAQAAAIKDYLTNYPGIDRAFLKTELVEADLGGDIIANLNHPNSGDVVVFVDAEYSFGRSEIQVAAEGLGDNDGRYYWDCSNDYRGGHGGLTSTEQYVPFVLWGSNIQASCDLGSVYNADWAPTIAALLGIDPPYNADGSPALSCMKPSNQLPVLAAIGAQGGNELEELTFTAAATDADIPAQPLTFSLANGTAGSVPSGAVIDPATGVFTWTPSEEQGGAAVPFIFDVCVSDGKASDCETIQFTITEVNIAPTLAPIGSQSVDELQTLSFSASATDADLPANTFLFSLGTGATEGASIDPASGVFAWTPGEAQGPSDYTFDVCVSDGVILTPVCETISVTVNEVNIPPTLNPIDPKIVNELEEVTFTAQAADTDLPPDTLSFSLSGGAPGSLDPASGVYTWTPAESDGFGVFNFAVTVSDGSGGGASQPVQITVNEVNIAPVLDPIGNKSIDEEKLLSFFASGTDIDFPPNTLIYYLDSAPAGAVIDPVTGLFSWIPIEEQGPGGYAVNVCINDGIVSDCEVITVTVNEVNVAPVLDPIGNKTVDEETPLGFTTTASDHDDPTQILNFSLVGAPTGASITSGGAFTWVSTEGQGPSGYTFDVCVSDEVAAAVCETITVTVNEVNVAPVLDPIGNKTVDEETSLGFTATASDHDDPTQILNFSLVGAPTGASITSGGAFTWMPTEGQGPADHTFDVCVSDGVAAAVCETITVKVNEVNVAPVLDPIGNKTVDEETPLGFTATVSDHDIPEQTLTFSLDMNAPEGANIDPISGYFTWVPNEAQGPSGYTFDVCVSDGEADPVCEIITVTVNEVNVAPVLDSIGSKTIDEETLLDFTAIASDHDIPLQTLTFSLGTNAPEGANIDPISGYFTWVPNEAQGPSGYTFDVCVSDGEALPVCETITVTVNEVNVAPVLNPVGDKTVDEETPLAFIATASDHDIPLQTRTFSLADGTAGSVPAGAVITAGGAFTWTPTEAQGPADYTFDVCVSDGVAAAVCETITVTVSEVNVAPLLETIGNKTVDWGRELTFTAKATDHDLPANELTYSLSDGDHGSIDPATGVYSWTPSAGEIGEHTFKVVVTDDGNPNLSDEEEITILVTQRTTSLSYTGETSGQYSDGVTVSATLLDEYSVALSGKTITFTLGSQTTTAVTGDDGKASTTLYLNQVAGSSYTVTAEFATETSYIGTSDSKSFTINVEEATAIFSTDNPVAVPVASAGGSSGSFNLAVFVEETYPDSGTAPAAGDLSKAEVGMVLTPVGPGSPVSVTCVKAAVTDTGYDSVLPVTCSFNSVPVNTYTIEFKISGSYYVGYEEDVLVVYDPSLGFTTGGGWFYWPGTTDRVNFGYTMKYNKKGTNVQGSLLMIRHMSDGSIYRLKSNALYGLALGSDPNVPLGWASFSGKATYMEPGWLEPVGNYEFIVYVEDRNEPGTGVDRFWITIQNGISLLSPAESNAINLLGGNLVVPHTSKR